MLVHFRRRVISDAPGRVGRWLLVCERDLPAVPQDGDLIELAPGWASERVRHTTFTAAGEVHVDLRTVTTDSPDTLREEQRLTDTGAWRWFDGGPFSTPG